ncbi:ABC transporter ATP-binding protein [Desulfosediminicola ganghwensis]|uniref:ABC transporter ATP-binding protein n=1 Tax=Desulfosediminicola ganghwensis TaxID=2569540 RepID=UPI0010AB7829|nr:ABC transporter ATP-binding protein [Desulfosediminicola ganghwensis]
MKSQTTPPITPLLEIKDLQTWFHTEDGIVKGCDKVNYSVNKGETLAVVGESGSGKSVTAMSILGLIPNPPGEITGGEILFRGENLLELNSNEMQRIRGNSIAMIFQEPMTSLNPVMTVGQQIGESLVLHQGYSRSEAKQKAIELLAMVGIADGRARVDEYPHQLSGGMRQRVMIAIALACKPELLIADEPTSALDVTIQAQILELIAELQQKIGMAVILITHDMGVVAETADKVAVMYSGQIVEYGKVNDIFFNARHPYLEGLINSVLDIDEEMDMLDVIDGTVPDPLDLPGGCNFEPRCPKRMNCCKTEEPPRTSFGNEHYACCWLYSDTKHEEVQENG